MDAAGGTDGRLYYLLVAVRDGLDGRLVSSNYTGGNTGSFNPPTFDTDSGLPRQKSEASRTLTTQTIVVAYGWLSACKNVLQLLIGAKGLLRKYMLFSKDDMGFHC